MTSPSRSQVQWARLRFAVIFIFTLQIMNVFYGVVIWGIGVFFIHSVLDQPIPQFFWGFAAGSILNTTTVDIAAAHKKHPQIPTDLLAHCASVSLIVGGLILAALIVWNKP